MAARLTLEFQHHNASTAREARDVVQSIYTDARAESIAGGDPFYAVDAFMNRFDAYTDPRNSGFALAVARLPDGTPIGQAWGWPLPPNAAWWTGLLTEPEGGFTRETGARTFALSEIMVRRAWTGQGVAHALHDELLRTRPEERATLLVNQTNTRAATAYLRWGWRKTAELRPGWPDAPLMDVLILDLPPEPAGT